MSSLGVGLFKVSILFGTLYFTLNIKVEYEQRAKLLINICTCIVLVLL